MTTETTLQQCLDWLHGLKDRLHWALVAMGHNSWEDGTDEQREQFRNVRNLLIELGVAV